MKLFCGGCGSKIKESELLPVDLDGNTVKGSACCEEPVYLDKDLTELFVHVDVYPTPRELRQAELEIADAYNGIDDYLPEELFAIPS